jgi:ABC-2 type transport system permease protein
MSAFATLLHKELDESRRTLRLPVVLGAFLFLGILAPLMAFLTPNLLESTGNAALAAALPRPTITDAIDTFVKNINQIGSFIAILLAMGLVANDRERGTAAFVLTKPVSRGAYLAARFVPLALLLGVGVAIATVVTYVYGSILFTTPPGGDLAAASLLLWLSLLVPAAITFLASTVGRSAMVAAMAGFGWWVVSSLVGALPGIGGNLPGGLTAVARNVALGGTSEAVLLPAVTSLAVVLLALGAAWTAFRTQEL